METNYVFVEGLSTIDQHWTIFSIAKTYIKMSAEERSLKRRKCLSECEELSTIDQHWTIFSIAKTYIKMSAEERSLKRRKCLSECEEFLFVLYISLYTTISLTFTIVKLLSLQWPLLPHIDKSTNVTLTSEFCAL